MTYPVIDREPISDKERNQLAKAIIGFGNLKKCVDATGLSEPTIKHAIGGFTLNPPTREKIRAYLESINHANA